MHSRFEQPGLFGEAPVLRNATGVATVFDVEPVRVFGDHPVRGAQGVVAVAVRTASFKLLLCLGHGRGQTYLTATQKTATRCTTLNFCVQTSSGFWNGYSMEAFGRDTRCV